MKTKPLPVPPQALSVVHLPIVSIIERLTNARLHTNAQIRKIAKSIHSFGFLVPVLVDGHNVLLAGHGRLAAARHLGMRTVPTLRIEGLTEAQQRSFMLADNKLTDLSSFDAEKLKVEFQFLIESDGGFVLEASGFDIVEVDKLLNFETATSDRDLVKLPSEGTVAVSRVGDLWHIGTHRLLCGSALERLDYLRLFGTARAAMVFTDPPYNVRIAGNVSGLGKKVHREFVMASGEMTPAEFTWKFLRPACELIRDHVQPGAIGYFCMDWRHLRDLENAADGVFAEHKNTIVWVKASGALGTFYRSQHEMILVYKLLAGPHRNNFGLGAKRYRTNVWQYAGANSFRPGRAQDLDDHPTVKPLKMVVDAILDCSSPGDIIFDAFVGSGTTLVAAAQTGRIGYALELDPKFVDVAVARLQKATGLIARLETGETFAEVAAARGVGGQEFKS